ncbi:winged helix-turn-helix transcriptional regulator [Pseudactinotalea suaedae]|uniref:winged helix-turn-helix transcriptional regulator n=1 Tax=Pseudactinotalea suaedae TaxID=1524924 RepID=UPI0013913AC0|nr:response regulator transcription factor [Pseudactinotalea suaedae]
MADLLMLTSEPGGSAHVLGALALLPHRVRVVPLEPSALLEAPDADCVLVDGRRDLARARATCQLMRTTGIEVPLMLIITEGGLSVVRMDWGFDDVVLASAGPAEVDARLRLVADRGRLAPDADDTEEIDAGELHIDAGGYTARLRGEPLDLTYKEFELLKYLSQHPGRVFTRAQLLQDVWGYDYFGGTRTVDVHVRRLRAKLGPEHDSMIGTVRNVGYRFESQRDRRESRAESRGPDALHDAGPTSA